jgi:hypothetical protein
MANDFYIEIADLLLLLIDVLLCNTQCRAYQGLHLITFKG